MLLIINKIDQISKEKQQEIDFSLSKAEGTQHLLISAKTGEGVDELKTKLLDYVNTGALRNNETIVTNSRHYDALLKALEEIEKVQWGIDNDLTSDLMAIDIREALYHFGEITGQATNDHLLGNIFANFYIGKQILFLIIYFVF